MDAYQAIITKLDVREFAEKAVPREVKMKILESARATGSSMNTQHWRFLLLQGEESLARLAADSTTGGWVAGADFAVVVLTDPKVPGHAIDAGRVLQDMELAAWDSGVASRLYTGFKKDELRRDFNIPPEMEISVVLGFGYPLHKVVGKKDRKPLDELVFVGRYGDRFSEGGLR